jgi:hypothetical protein
MRYFIIYYEKFEHKYNFHTYLVEPAGEKEERETKADVEKIGTQ